MPAHPALQPGHTAVITGAASGIGLATARTYAALGLNVVLADLPGAALDAAASSIEADGGRASAVATDVSDAGAVAALLEAAVAAFGPVHVVMNNAATGNGAGPWEKPERWAALLATNLGGVINGVQTFLPHMIGHGGPGLVINTGSKQGITCPPGNTAYNVSKAGVKVLTEGVAHELRNTVGDRITAHLLVPGYTHTGMTGAGEKPPAAWTAQQVVDFMLESLARGDFYILCPDNAVTRADDEKRMAWAMGDLINNRPALSRWHPDWKDRFEAFLRD